MCELWWIWKRVDHVDKLIQRDGNRRLIRFLCYIQRVNCQQNDHTITEWLRQNDSHFTSSIIAKVIWEGDWDGEREWERVRVREREREGESKREMYRCIDVQMCRWRDVERDRVWREKCAQTDAETFRYRKFQCAHPQTETDTNKFQRRNSAKSQHSNVIPIKTKHHSTCSNEHDDQTNWTQTNTSPWRIKP